MRRLVVLLAVAALCAVPLVPAVAATRVAPSLTLSVAPRYPKVGATAALTARVGGRYGAGTGWVRFRFDGVVIAGCRHVALRRGVAHCTAPRALSAVRHFALGYFGDAHYRGAWVYRTVYS